MANRKAVKKEKNFKEMFEELREINSWFEDEDIDLDEGLKKLKQGKDLIDKCKEKLADVENEFEELTKEIEEEPTDDEGGNDEPPVEVIKVKKKELPF